ncbi:hypothetical protein [Erythrobacter sp. THAF29]|uniref:hypothetical protein n=1 Tax=Erythrobacter sp. THAF29 TaxID=2587851 RepID=UPI0012690D92|nr:hypothetical protein [Erythrobacter sp. THAF29]QFT78610.1 hypothetical protein FIU90_13760 [Erythrobacter sp. THAF29]
MVERYKSLWKWMLVPLLVMQAGIFVDYWGDFSENTWAVHIHYWNATLWYLFLISQPWLFARGDMQRHRTLGMVGLLLAGGMVFLSVGQLNRDIVYANFARDNAGEIGPFTEWFFFQVLMIEVVLITAFIAAIVMAIVKRKSMEDHAWWMASTAFLLMMPALGRGLQGVWIGIHGFSPELTSVLTIPVYICQAIIIAMALGAALWLGKLRHPATWLAVGANAILFILERIARAPAVQAFWRSVIAA